MAKVQPFCSLCGQSMSFTDLPVHRQQAHPEVAALLAKTRRDYFRRHQVVFLPLLIAWGLLFVLGFYQGFLKGWLFIPYAVVGGAALIIVPWLNTRPATSERRRALSGIAIPCVFCGSSITLGTVVEHQKSHHPEAYRYGRLWRRVPLGLCLGYVAGALVVWLLYAVGYLGAEVAALVIVLLAVPVLGVAAWFRSAITRRVVALREREWRASHAGAGPEETIPPQAP